MPTSQFYQHGQMRYVYLVYLIWSKLQMGDAIIITYIQRGKEIRIAW